MVVRWSQSVKLLYVAPVSTGMCDRLRVGKPPRFVTSHSGPLKATQSSTLSLQWDGNEYRQKCGYGLQLASKGRYGSFRLWINVWVAGKTV